MYAKFDDSSFSHSRDITWGVPKFKVGHVTTSTPILGWFAILTLRLNIAYLRTKCDDCSLSRSIDMVGAHQHLNGSRDLTTPLSGIVCHPWASQPIYQIWSICLQPSRTGRRYKMWKMGWFGVVRGHLRCHSRSLEMAPFDRAHTSSY